MLLEKSPIYIVFIVCLMSIYALFNIKENVMSIKGELTEVNNQVQDEIDKIHLLKAELAEFEEVMEEIEKQFNTENTNITKYSALLDQIRKELAEHKYIEKNLKKFEITKMKGIKRPTRFYGIPLGHRRGINGELIDYYNARKLIYVPAYLWMLKNKTNSIITDLQDKALKSDIVLLDYTTNENIEDLSKPLSHASLIKMILIENDKSLLTNRFSSTNEDDLKNGQIEIDFT